MPSPHEFQRAIPHEAGDPEPDAAAALMWSMLAHASTERSTAHPSPAREPWVASGARALRMLAWVRVLALGLRAAGVCLVGILARRTRSS